VSPVRYELGFYILEDDILHSHRRKDLKSYITVTGRTLFFLNMLFPLQLGTKSWPIGLVRTDEDCSSPMLHSRCDVLGVSSQMWSGILTARLGGRPNTLFFCVFRATGNLPDNDVSNVRLSDE
jgi:hypothetical protein